MNDQEKIKELEYLNNEHRGVISILMDEREVLRERIAELEKQLAFMEGEYPEPTIVEKMKEFEKQSKPVAWMYQIHDITGWTWVIDQRLPDYEYRNPKPLYTNPHHAGDVKQTKPLSDEEIDEVFFKIFGMNPADKYALEFARAIEAKVRGEK